MACKTPLQGYRSRTKNYSGKRSIVFSRPAGCEDLPVSVPCKQCIDCRLEKSREWAIRCVHESELYDKNCFITLTFRPACPLLQKNGRRLKRLSKSRLVDPTFSLHKFHFKDFMKRLRHYLAGSAAANVRFFHCGEYGENLERPHHHACLFNYDFPDKELWQVRDGVRLYRSEILEKLWPYGYSTIGAVTFESAAYVARYVTKKITGSPAAAHYSGRLPEFCTQSRKPGIANQWLKNFTADVYPSDFLIIRENKKIKPPKYYDRIYDLTNPEKLSNVKALRIQNARQNPDNSPERQAVKLELTKLRAKKLVRGYENDPLYKKITVTTEVVTVGTSGAKITTKKKYVLKTGRIKKGKKCKPSTSIQSMMKKPRPLPPSSLSPTMEKLLAQSPTLRSILNRG